MRTFMRIGTLAALTFAGIVGFSGSASADGHATFEYHYRWCPEGAVDVFAGCHDNPIAGLDVWVEYDDDATDASAVVPTDEHGNAVFELDADSGPYTWEYDEAQDGAPVWPDDYGTSYCSLDGGDGANIEDEDWLTAVEAGPDRAIATACGALDVAKDENVLVLDRQSPEPTHQAIASITRTIGQILAHGQILPGDPAVVAHGRPAGGIVLTLGDPVPA